MKDVHCSANDTCFVQKTACRPILRKIHKLVATITAALFGSNMHHWGSLQPYRKVTMLSMAVLNGSISKGRDGEKDGRRGQRLEKGGRELPLHVVRYFLFLLNEYVMLCYVPTPSPMI